MARWEVHVANKQTGFTLIELVMVIVILGILAAFALPRFADLSNDARRAQIEAAAGSIKSASAIVHAAYLAAGNNPAFVQLEGQQVNLVNGYPRATTGGNSILGAAGITTGATGDFDVGQAGGNAAGQTVRIDSKGAPTPADCSVAYTAPNAGASPAIAIVTTGC